MCSKKKVTFNEVINYYYIPNNIDIQNFRPQLWWSPFDYIVFKNNYMIEIARNININIENNHQLKLNEVENEEFYIEEIFMS